MNMSIKIKVELINKVVFHPKYNPSLQYRYEYLVLRIQNMN